MNLKEAFDHLLFSTKITNNEYRVVLTELVDPLLFLKDRSRILSHILRLKETNAKTEQLKKIKLDEIPYFYFRNRQTKHTYAGFGIGDIVTPADDVDFFHNVQQKCHQLSLEYGCKVNYFASLSFSNSNSYSWGCFPSRLLVLPKILLIYDEKTQIQNILFFDQSDKAHQRHLAKINFISPCLNDIPQKGDFLRKFTSAQSFLMGERNSTQNPKKVVLALQKSATSKQSPIDILQKISSREENNFHFIYSIDGQTSFLGCTPEMLCHIQTNMKENTHTIYSEALAGTVVRGSNIREDIELEKQLLNSKKDEEEHQIVINGIVNILQEYCSSVLYEQRPSIKKQNFVQHLCTKITAEYKNTNNDILCQKKSLQHLIFALHPTPAVCGYPKEEAREVIAKIEDFDRGLYAGAIGIISFDEITLSVGIRSALHHEDQYWFWGGAGLVKSSKPKTEFEEMNNKMKAFEQLIEQENREQENREQENIIKRDNIEEPNHLDALQLKTLDIKTKSIATSTIKANDIKENNHSKENLVRKKVN